MGSTASGLKQPREAEGKFRVDFRLATQAEGAHCAEGSAVPARAYTDTGLAPHSDVLLALAERLGDELRGGGERGVVAAGGAARVATWRQGMTGRERSTRADERGEHNNLYTVPGTLSVYI